MIQHPPPDLRQRCDSTFAAWYTPRATMLARYSPEQRAELQAEGRYRAMAAAWAQAMRERGHRVQACEVVWPAGEAERVLGWRKR